MAGLAEGARSGKRPLGWWAAGVLSVWVFGALALATIKGRDTQFAVAARTTTLHATLGCGQRVTWDLPAGRVTLLDGSLADAPARDAAPVSVVLRDGARATLRVGDEGRLRLSLKPPEPASCDTVAPDAIAVRVGGQALPPPRDAARFEGYEYESGDPTVLRGAYLLRGRVVLGDEVVDGAGAPGEPPPVALSEGRIEARTLDWSTQLRRALHAEDIDNGAMFDTHACLDQAPAEAAACAAGRTTRAEGFFTGSPEGKGGLAVQLNVSGEGVGVRPQGAAQRTVAVAWWSTIVASPWAQIAGAALAIAASAQGLWAALCAFCAARRPPAPPPPTATAPHPVEPQTDDTESPRT